MGITFNPYEATKYMHKFVWYDDLLSKKELKEIAKFCSKLDLHDASTGNSAEVYVNDTIRKSKVSFVQYDDENSWVFEKLGAIAETVNNDYYRFDLTGFDRFQYTEYQGKKSHYDFHVDMFYGSASEGADLDDYYLNRKLSISILLNDVDEFEGGNFEFSEDGDTIDIAEQKLGRVLAFPSFVPHRVTPLISGVRKSLVYWVSGPKFR